jgi:P27 family predicted phage terminase small subunit
MTNDKPPCTLGKHGSRLWSNIQNEYGITDSGGAELLLQACLMLDRAEKLAAAIEREGFMLTSNNGNVRANPLVRDELSARAFVTKTLQRLGLDVAEAKRSPGRPTGLQWTGHDRRGSA